MYGCLSILLFGVVFIVISFAMTLFRLLFGVRRMSKRFQQAAGHTGGSARPDTSAGSHRSGSASQASGRPSSAGSRDNRDEKFFRQDEGEYIDFEEVK